jgi:tRNA threonylcarbamoyladenosine biosynthesis protein TsaE
MIEHFSHSAEDTMQFAETIAKRLQGGELLALHGDLGAGKTCFVRGLSRGLGIKTGAVSSPTFVIMHEYVAEQGASPHVLVHIDAYRLGGGAELESVGWDEFVGRADTVVALEWPERVHEALPIDRLDVTLEHYGGERRLIRVEPRGKLPLLPVMAESTAASMRPCPICKTAVATDAETFPFCSRRCRMADLHRWMGEGYRVSRPATDPRDWEEQQE